MEGSDGVGLLRRIAETIWPVGAPINFHLGPDRPHGSPRGPCCPQWLATRMQDPAYGSRDLHLDCQPTGLLETFDLFLTLGTFPILLE